MTKDELTKRLLDGVMKQVTAAGRHMGDGADHDLRALVEVGAGNLAEIEDPDEQEANTRQAEVDLGRLIDDAISVARNLENYPRDKLGEETFYPARFRFCPCRPFC